MGDLVVMQSGVSQWVMDRIDIPIPLPSDWIEMGPWNPSTSEVGVFFVATPNVDRRNVDRRNVDRRNVDRRNVERLNAGVIRAMENALVRVPLADDRITVMHRDDVPKDKEPLGPWSLRTETPPAQPYET